MFLAFVPLLLKNSWIDMGYAFIIGDIWETCYEKKHIFYVVFVLMLYTNLFDVSDTTPHKNICAEGEKGKGTAVDDPNSALTIN